jgi:hypothetical protein
MHLLRLSSPEMPIADANSRVEQGDHFFRAYTNLLTEPHKFIDSMLQKDFVLFDRSAIDSGIVAIMLRQSRGCLLTIVF